MPTQKIVNEHKMMMEKAFEHLTMSLNHCEPEGRQPVLLKI
jgi:hypothetical protein